MEKLTNILFIFVMLQSGSIYAYKISHNKGLASNESLENNTSVLLGCSDSQSPYLFNKMLQSRQQHNAVELTPANAQQEIWKDIPNYEGLYQVSNLGNVKSMNYLHTNKEKLLKPRIDTTGYFIVGLYKHKMQKKRTIHQLVAVVFLNHKPCGYKLVINHIDFNKLNNNVNNLEIVTNRENANKKHLKSSSKYTGVCYLKDRNKWQSQIIVNGNKIYLGIFKEEKEASNAYQLYLKNLIK